MIAYKYFTSNVRDLILAGSVKLSSLGYFRNLEQRQIEYKNKATERTRIGDKNEATDRLKASFELIGKGQGPTIKYPDGLHVITGINKSSDATLIVSDLEARDQKDALIYSATTLRTDNYWLEELNPAYDSSIEITDLDLLASRLEGEIKKLCPSNYLNYQIDQCRYEDINTEDFDKPLEANPFRKDTFFSAQKEIRIVFFFLHPLPEVEVIFRIDPTDLFTP